MDWIVFEPNVIRTLQTDIVIEKLMPYFQAAGFVGRVTSVLRNKFQQLMLIQELAIQAKIIDTSFVLDFEYMSSYQGQVVPYWQIVWSKLLNAGIIVNPPTPAVVLMSYIKNNIDKKGMLIGATPHQSGLCIDFGGRVFIECKTSGVYDTLVFKLDEVYNIVQKAKLDGIGIDTNIDNNPLIEHANNAVHCQVLSS
jgi:hypothetical protein